MTRLIRGANAPVETAQVTVAVRYRGSARVPEVDISAFILRTGGKVAGDEDMVFYGQTRSGDGRLQLVEADPTPVADRAATVFQVDLAGLGDSAEAVAFTATIHEGAARGLTLSELAALEVAVLDGARELLNFPVETAGASEVAMILGQLYRHKGAWKFRAVGQGFKGGLKPLAEHFGVEIADTPAAPPPAPEPAPAPAPATVNLSKITLSKASPTVRLAKKSAHYQQIKINLDWNRPATKSGLFGFGTTNRGGVDLDLGCLFELQDGRKGAVQALGNHFGDFDDAPWIQLAGDDRTGAVEGGEWMRINGGHWDRIRRVLIYAFIYEGAPNWAATDAVVMLYSDEGPPVEVRLDEGRNDLGLCAITLLENRAGQMQVSREMRYFQEHPDMDRVYGWGMNWRVGSK